MGVNEAEEAGAVELWAAGGVGGASGFAIACQSWHLEGFAWSWTRISPAVWVVVLALF